jgi:uncharacterized membrane protein
VLTATAAIAQLLTGLTIVRLGGHDLGQTWLGASLARYLLNRGMLAARGLPADQDA